MFCNLRDTLLPEVKKPYHKIVDLITYFLYLLTNYYAIYMIAFLGKWHTAIG